MDTRQPVAIRRCDYQPSDWKIDHVRLDVELAPAATIVTSELSLCRREAPGNGQGSAGPGITLTGVELELRSISVDGRILDVSDYVLTHGELHVPQLPDQCILRIVTCIDPDANTALEGLYRSSGTYCTQCEAEGFRKITYFLDRPDVLSVYDVSITADASACPVLLSNGNRIAQETLDHGRHRVHWHDPHPKPSYLFALVAGDLAHVDDHFITASGHDVLLQIYVEKHNIARCDFAMQSLKAAMRWDEEVYGFEYDLDCFMIVAVDDFNMGAMENKGLNIFNSRYVLADVESATDNDFKGVEAVIAHEYFHNLTGNRITCRDWFQLSLKEGLTVFRDQCFYSDRHSPTVKRIEDVRLLRSRQFPEDSGPMAHPVRPESYIEINNFYTVTVYEKGAEVIRMLHTLLGPVRWRHGMDVYVERHDGTATTCDAFVDAMQSVTDIDLTRFRRWYSTAGTPELHVTEHYDAATACYQLTVTQHCPDTPGQKDKEVLHIPLVMGLLDAQGRNLPVGIGRLQGSEVDSAGVEAMRDATGGTAGKAMGDAMGSVLLDIMDRTQTYVFDNMPERPTASLLRGFSAPVKLVHDVSDEVLAFLMARDTDAFNRWDAGQRLAGRAILGVLSDESAAQSTLELLMQAWGSLLTEASREKSQGMSPDWAFLAEALTLPTIETLEGSLQLVDYQALVAAHTRVSSLLADRYADALVQIVTRPRKRHQPALEPAVMGERRLAGTALALLACRQESHWVALAESQYHAADNMTDRLAALSCLCHGNSPARQRCLEHFLAQADGKRLVVDKWFAVQAMAHRPGVVDDVVELANHASFDADNPNRLRSLTGSFALNNPGGFHAQSGRGYRFLADQIISLDKRNPQLAARLLPALIRWRRLSSPCQELMRQELMRIRDNGPLSPDVFELVSKALE